MKEGPDLRGFGGVPFTSGFDQSTVAAKYRTTSLHSHSVTTSIATSVSCDDELLL